MKRIEELSHEMIKLKRENCKMNEELSLWRQMSLIMDSVKELLVIGDIKGCYEFVNDLDADSIISLIVKYDHLMIAIDGLDEDYDNSGDDTENFIRPLYEYDDDFVVIKEEKRDDEIKDDPSVDEQMFYEKNIKLKRMININKRQLSRQLAKRKYIFQKKNLSKKCVSLKLKNRNVKTVHKKSLRKKQYNQIDEKTVFSDGESRYVCNYKDIKSGLLCEKQFKGLSMLINHQNGHSGDRPWFCEWTNCDYRAVQRNHLIGHMRKSHTGRYQFKCDWPGCSFRGPSRYNVKRHRTIHTGEKPYKCDWPGCDFESPNNKLTVHKRIHTGEKPYPCDWPGCDARFSRLFTLRNHKRTHTGEKPFACDWPGCEYRSAQQTPLVTHRKKHHGTAEPLMISLTMSSEIITNDTYDDGDDLQINT